ncbi:chromosomal replication initiator protein DnaA [Alphaproteobacteria bacterium]|nr:chromosomal replication initiator protein DnaA [Alphaproteobacteria bacterium]
MNKEFLNLQEVIDCWEKISLQLKIEIGETAFNSWLKQIKPIGIENNTLSFTAPSRFLKDWVVSHYAKKIEEFLYLETNSNIKVNIEVDNNIYKSNSKIETHEEKIKNNSSYEVPIYEVGASLDPRFTFDAFVVGKPNELAYAAALRAAEASTVPFNPLYLYGGVGLGKTHLMHAIAWHIRECDPSRKVIYLSAEKFMYQFIRALRYKDVMSFKQLFRSVDVLMIDDVQFISGKESTQEEFFHTFNALVDQNRQVIISGDRSPSNLDGMEERMRSRLGYGLAADIHQTDYELRVGILQSKVQQLQAKDFPNQVMEFLAHKITSNVRELEGALTRVLAYSNLVGRPITLETTQEVLRDLLRSNDRRITIEDIQKRVAEHYNIRIAEMHSARRARAVARPRQVAMYLAKQLTSRSLPEIGRKFGGRDHTTVMHAVRRIDELQHTDRILSEDVDLLKRMLET